MPFDNNAPPAPKRGLKINNQNSSVPQPKPSQTAAFTEQAQKIFDKQQDYKQRMWELSTKFKSMIEDRVLAENKSPISKEIEKETLDKLIALASEMDADENLPEGLGSISLSMLLMKMVLLQRDTMNALAYKIEKLEKTQIKSDNIKSQ